MGGGNGGLEVLYVWNFVKPFFMEWFKLRTGKRGAKGQCERVIRTGSVREVGIRGGL